MTVGDVVSHNVVGVHRTCWQRRGGNRECNAGRRDCDHRINCCVSHGYRSLMLPDECSGPPAFGIFRGRDEGTITAPTAIGRLW